MNLNKVFLFGNLTRDPELRQTPGGQAVCSFGIATNRSFTDQAGQKRDQVEFHNVVAWGRQGEVIAQYMKKGSSMLIEGRLQTRNWQDQQGAKHYRTEVIIEEFQFGPRTGGGAGGGNFQNRDEEDSGVRGTSPRNQPSGRPSQQDNVPIIEIPHDSDVIDVKDIPF